MFILRWEVLNQARRVRAKLSTSGEDETTTGWCAINWPSLHSHGRLAVRQSSGQGVKKTRSSHSEMGIEGKLSIFRFSPIFYLSLGKVSHNSPSPLLFASGGGDGGEIPLIIALGYLAPWSSYWGKHISCLTAWGLPGVR